MVLVEVSRNVGRVSMCICTLGIGGSIPIPEPYRKDIISFREWEHFHNPLYPFPEHRFWTWGIMNATSDSDAGKCAYGVKTSREDIDIRFECDKPVIEEKIKSFPNLHWHGIGNEPNWGPYIKPEDYTYQFNKYKEYILNLDPLAEIMLGGLTLPVAWKNWFNKLEIEPDIYDIHPYPGAGDYQTSIDEVIEFREFVNNNKPIVLGEFSTLSGDENKDLEYMKGFGSWLTVNCGKYNIIGWYWWIGTDLFNSEGITKLGETYIKYFKPREEIYLPVILK